VVRVLLLLAILATTAAAPAAAVSQAKVPAALRGNWGRTVTDADWQRVGKPGGNTGRFSMNIASTGDLVLAEALGTISTALGYHRVSIGGICTSGKGVYSWKVVGRKLTLTKLHDKCADAAAPLVGVWTRY
jgi:hypothetical protein